MWIFNRKKRLKPAKAKSFHEKRLRFPEREGEDGIILETSSTVMSVVIDKFDRDEDDDKD